MRRIDVVGRWNVHHLCRQQHPRMFARTVVVQRRRLVARGPKLRRRFLIVRNMRAAQEVGFIELALPQQRGRGGDMHRAREQRDDRVVPNKG